MRNKHNNDLTINEYNNKTGFTLIEILVSLAVFGLVMASAAGGLYYLYKDWQKQRDYLQCIENARWAMEFMTNEARKGGNAASAGLAFIADHAHLRFVIDTDGDNSPDARVWYWRGAPPPPIDLGQQNTLYRGVDTSMLPGLPLSLNAANATRQELAGFIASGQFDVSGGVVTVELTVRPYPGQNPCDHPTAPVSGNCNYTLRTQVRPRELN